MKTVEFYLQEVAAQLLLQQLSAASRAKIAILQSYASRLVAMHPSGCAKHHSGGNVVV